MVEVNIHSQESVMYPNMQMAILFREKIHNLSKSLLFEVAIHDLQTGKFGAEPTLVANLIESFFDEITIPDEKLLFTIHDPKQKILFLGELLSASLNVLSEAKENISQVLSVTPEVFKELVKEEIIHAEDKKKLQPLIMQSSLLLIDPALQNIIRLQNQRADMSAIGRVTGIDITALPQGRTEQGLNAIIAINAAKNAVRFAEKARALGLDGIARMYTDNESNLVIENISANPLPPHFAAFGVTGEGGNTGMGMGIMSLYYGLQGRDIFKHVQQKELEDNKGWLISVTIPR